MKNKKIIIGIAIEVAIIAVSLMLGMLIGSKGCVVHTHDFGEWETVKASTCFEKGEKSRTCACGKIQTMALDFADHTSVAMSSVNATCTESGSTGGTKCAVCDVVLTSPQITEKRDHSYYKTVVSATCISEGYTLTRCSNCDYSHKDEYTPKTDHQQNSNGICTSCKVDLSLKIEERLGDVSLSWRAYQKGSGIFEYHYIEANCNAINLSEKQIKYIKVYFDYINKVGDIAFSYSYRFIGPYDEGQNIPMNLTICGDNGLEDNWSLDFYYALEAGEEITDVRIGKIVIEYFDGTTEVCK